MSKKIRYAIKALPARADDQADEPVRISDLARAEQIPPKFLEFILLGLRNQGILRVAGQGRGIPAGPKSCPDYLSDRSHVSPTAYVPTRVWPIVRLELDLVEDGRAIEAQITRARFFSLPLR